MSRLPSTSASSARGEFSEMVNRAAFGKERVIVTRHGKALAAIVPMEDMRKLQALEDETDSRTIAKRRSSWLRSGRKGTTLEAVAKKHRAKS